jgi:hypothetical protein
MIDDKDPGVCRRALVVFGRIKDELAVEPVARHLPNPDITLHCV